MDSLKRFVQDCVILFSQSPAGEKVTPLDPFVEQVYELLHSNYVASISQIKECSAKDLTKLNVPVALATILINEAKKGPTKHTTLDASTQQGQGLVSTVLPTPTEFYFELKKTRLHHQFYETDAIGKLVKDFNLRKLLLEIAMIITRISMAIHIIGMLFSFVVFSLGYGFGYENWIIISFMVNSGVYRVNSQDVIHSKVTMAMICVGVIIFISQLVGMILCTGLVLVLEHLYRNVVFAIMKKHRKNVKEVAIKVNISGDRYLCVSC